MQKVKRRFFAMRNGVIADTIRRAGFSYKIIFGLNLPQIAEIAADFAPDPELAASLWADVRCRESRLLAPMILDPEKLDAGSALALATDVNTTEVADILCHRLLRRRPDLAEGLTASLLATGDPLQAYTALRLWLNILAAIPPGSPESATLTVRLNSLLPTLPEERLTLPVLRQLRDELEFRP